MLNENIKRIRKSKGLSQDGCMMLQSAIPSTRRADFFRDLNNLPFDRLQA